MNYHPSQLNIRAKVELSNGQFFVYCPFHQNPSGKSAIFFGENGGMFCFSCHNYWSKEKLSHEQGVSVPKVKRYKAKKQKSVKTDWKELYDINPLVASGYRGLSKETIQHFDIRESRSLVYIPIQDTGVIVRNKSKNGSYYKFGNIPGVIYNRYELNHQKPFYLFENTFGYLKAWQFGYRNIALAPSTNIKIEWLLFLSRCKQPIVWFNPDYAGYSGIYEIYLFNRNIKILLGEPDNFDSKEEFEINKDNFVDISYVKNILGDTKIREIDERFLRKKKYSRK